MRTCINHPDIETSLVCMKHEVYMCDECVHCRDPEIYCKFRPSCPIWFMHKENRRKQRALANQAASAPGEAALNPDGKQAGAGAEF